MWADYRIQQQSRILEPGMVLTVEPGLYFDPEREAATFYLREYSEQEMWERRDRLGMAAAKALEEEEKSKAETISHPVPQEYRGIGVRIEDDILITADGCEVLTAGTPKTVDDVERACREAPRLPRPWSVTSDEWSTRVWRGGYCRRIARQLSSRRAHCSPGGVRAGRPGAGDTAPRLISARGAGRVAVKPDLAVVRLGAETRAPTVADATADVARR